MIVDIYSAECAMSKDEDVCCRWVMHRFYPIALSANRTRTGYLVETVPGPSVKVSAPLAMLSNDKTWLKLVSGKRYDATTTLLIAKNNHKYVKLVQEKA